MTNQPLIVCLTPVKNEAWVLDRFLQCASHWADHIIIADQGSTDGSQEIAKKYPKVMLVENKEKQFQGTGMRKLLLHESRKIPGSKLLIALDADEILPLSLFNSAEWQDVLQSAEGTRMQMRIANLWPDFSGFYSDDAWYYLGFMDDHKSDIEGGVLHEPRLPYLEDNPAIQINALRFLHYPYLSKQRNESKQRWYMVYERVMNKRTAFSILNQYHPHHHPEMLHRKQKHYSMPENIVQEYERIGIDITSVADTPPFWWDGEVLRYFADYGSRRFEDLDVWYVDWKSIAQKLKMTLPSSVRFRPNWINRFAVSLFKSHYQQPRNLLFRIGMRIFRFLGY